MTRPRAFTEEEQQSWVPLAAVLELLPGRIDAQLIRDEGLTHFDYFTLAMLSASRGHTMRMSELAAMTNATLPRLSHVITRLERRGLVRREPCPDDARATNAVITSEGRHKVIAATPGHVETVRALVLDALTPQQLGQLREITQAILNRLDPDGRMMATHRSRASFPDA